MNKEQQKARFMRELAEMAIASISLSSCCRVAIDVPEYDETNENAPQNYGIYHCPKCENECSELIE